MTFADYFGHSVVCPVCLNIYEKRIMQCSQGHSVCETCYMRLKLCPTCRSLFAGSRNYALEDILLKIKNNTTNDLNQQPDGLYNANEQDIIHSEQPLPVVKNFVHSLKDGPVQESGHYRCRVESCPAYLPVCRMHNHVRYHHAQNIIENPLRFTDTKVLFQYTGQLAVRSMCRIAKVVNMGLCFIVVDVSRNQSERIVSVWLESVSSAANARNYFYNCQLLFDDKSAFYSDIPYGGNPDVSEVIRKHECLQVCVPFKIKQILLQITISKYNKPSGSTRNSITTIQTRTMRRNSN